MLKLKVGSFYKQSSLYTDEYSIIQVIRETDLNYKFIVIEHKASWFYSLHYSISKFNPSMLNLKELKGYNTKLYNAIHR